MRFQEHHTQQNEALVAKAGLLSQRRGEVLVDGLSMEDG